MAHGFARLSPRTERAPTTRDAAQSNVHHADSVRFNLAHGITHLKEAQKHAAEITGRMASAPETREHVRALRTALGAHDG